MVLEPFMEEMIRKLAEAGGRWKGCFSSEKRSEDLARSCLAIWIIPRSQHCIQEPK